MNVVTSYKKFVQSVENGDFSHELKQENKCQVPSAIEINSPLDSLTPDMGVCIYA